MYRIFYRDQANAICGRQEYEADNDLAATRVARCLSDARADRCSSYELWQGTHLLHEGHPEIVADLTEWVGDLVVRTEELLADSRWSVADSRRLLQRLAQAKTREYVGK